MKLVKINEEHYVVVDDSEIKEGDWYYLPRTHSVYQCKEDATELNLERDFGVSKVTHSTQPLEWFTYDNLSDEVFSMDYHNIKPISLQEVKELIGEVDVEKQEIILTDHQKELLNIGNVSYKDSSIIYYLPYIFINENSKWYMQLKDNKEKKYTEEDLRKAFFNGGNMKEIEEFNSFIQSLQHKTEWEVEIVEGKLKRKNHE